jgi:Na+-driven multidrug efflux pump
VVFIFPLLFNSIQFFNLLRVGHIEGSSLRAVGIAVSYFNIALTFTVLYMFIYAINPKCKESK